MNGIVVKVSEVDFDKEADFTGEHNQPYWLQKIKVEFEDGTVKESVHGLRCYHKPYTVGEKYSTSISI